MANEIKASYVTGSTLTAKVYTSVGALRDTISLTETPASSGLYLGDYAAIDNGDVILILDGSDVVGGEVYDALVSSRASSSALITHDGKLDTVDGIVDFIQNVLEGDVELDISDSAQIQIVHKIKGTSTELIRKDLKGTDGTAITSTNLSSILIGQHQEP